MLTRSITQPVTQSLPGSITAFSKRSATATQVLRNLLFGSGQQGAFYVPKPTVDGQQVLYQDSAGTTPVTADGQPVGYIKDLSGNGNHATQSTAASKLIYRTDGILHWFEHDGVDDAASMSGITTGVDHAVYSASNITNAGGYIFDCSAGRFIVYNSTDRGFGYFDGSFKGVAHQSGDKVLSVLNSASGGSQLRVDGVNIDSRAYNETTIGGNAAYGGYNSASGSSAVAGKSYGLIISEELGSSSEVEIYLADLQGRTL